MDQPKNPVGNPNIANEGHEYRFQPGNRAAARKAPSTGNKAIRLLAAAETPEDVELAIARARNHPMTRPLVDALLGLADDPKLAVQVAQDLLDRVDGKATQRQEITGADGAPFWERISRAPEDGDGVE